MRDRVERGVEVVEVGGAGDVEASAVEVQLAKVEEIMAEQTV